MSELKQIFYAPEIKTNNNRDFNYPFGGILVDRQPPPKAKGLVFCVFRHFRTRESKESVGPAQSGGVHSNRVAFNYSSSICQL